VSYSIEDTFLYGASKTRTRAPWSFERHMGVRAHPVLTEVVTAVTATAPPVFVVVLIRTTDDRCDSGYHRTPRPGSTKRYHNKCDI
jgi:hypothetical protein